MRSRLSIFFACLFVLGLFMAVQAQTQPNEEEIKDKIVSIINGLRATLNPPAQPLQRWREGESCANEQAKVDNEKGPHYSAQHGGWCGGQAYEQNSFPSSWDLASVYGFGLQNMWDEKAPNNGHRLAMENRNYTSVAIGLYHTTGEQYWINMNFK